MKQTTAQILLAKHLKELGYATCPEYKFSEDRKFRFDLFDRINYIGYEVDGGQFSGGHMRGKALESQYEKDRLAQLYGYKILRFTNREVLSGDAKAWLKENL